MEIHLDSRAIRQLRLSIADAIEEGDTETLREDLIEAFSEDDIEEIERRVDSGDFYDFVSEILDEWSGEDVEELFELLEQELGEVEIDIKFASSGDDDEEEEEEESDDDEDVDVGSDGDDEFL